MRAVAAIPAVGLLSGAAVGLLVADPPFVLAYVLMSSGVAGAMFAWTLRRPAWLAVSVAVGFFTTEWIRDAAEGIAQFAHNGGQSRWIISPRLSLLDYDMLKNADGTLDPSRVELGQMAGRDNEVSGHDEQ